MDGSSPLTSSTGIARAAAGLGAAESIWVPASLLPGRGTDWRAEADDHIVASLVVAPEHPEIHLIALRALGALGFDPAFGLTTAIQDRPP